jgi:hypothetical protein
MFQCSFAVDLWFCRSLLSSTKLVCHVCTWCLNRQNARLLLIRRCSPLTSLKTLCIFERRKRIFDVWMITTSRLERPSPPIISTVTITPHHYLKIVKLENEELSNAKQAITM